MTGPPQIPAKDSPVADHEDLHRAIQPVYVESGEISSGAFYTKNMSLDVASLTTVDESRGRKPAWFHTTVPCSSFRALQYQPVHDPIVDHPDLGTNVSHAIVPGRMSKSASRAIALEAARLLRSPLSP
jgi:hypothetical protein